MAREYRSALRASQAQQTRERVLRAAAECFAESGYAGTTLANIAQAADVSVETVKLAAPKHQLLLSAFEVAFAGSEGDEGIAEREEGRRLVALTDDDAFLDGLIAVTATANARAAGLWTAFLSAGQSDPQVRERLDDLLRRRRTDYGRAVDEFARRGMIGASVDRGSLPDILSFVLSPEGYQQLVDQAGWTPAAYAAWLGTEVRSLLTR